MPDCKPATIVFDFDHTLTRWDSSARFFRWLLRRGVWRLALLAAAVPILAPLLAVRRWRRQPVRFAVWLATLGRSQARIATLARQHVDALRAAGEVLILRDAVAQLRRHLAQGQCVVIATGSLQVLADAYLDHSGLSGVPLVGSTLKPFMGGMAADAHCIGARKIDMLRARGYPPPWTFSYSDHAVDLPLLLNSTAFALVNPRPATVQAVRERLGRAPPILNWR